MGGSAVEELGSVYEQAEPSLNRRLFPHYSSWKSVDRWDKAVATIYNAITQL